MKIRKLSLSGYILKTPQEFENEIKQNLITVKKVFPDNILIKKIPYFVTFYGVKGITQILKKIKMDAREKGQYLFLVKLKTNPLRFDIIINSENLEQNEVVNLFNLSRSVKNILRDKYNFSCETLEEVADNFLKDNSIAYKLFSDYSKLKIVIVPIKPEVIYKPIVGHQYMGIAIIKDISILNPQIKHQLLENVNIKLTV